MAKKVLLLGIPPQTRQIRGWIKNGLAGDPITTKDIPKETLRELLKDAEMRYWTCLYDGDVNLRHGITWSKTPEDRSTWNLPEWVLYTGKLRDYEYTDDERIGSTVERPEDIEEMLREYGIQNFAKIEIDKSYDPPNEPRFFPVKKTAKN